MKLVQVFVPVERDDVYDVLDEKDIDFVRMQTRGKPTAEDAGREDEQTGDLLMFPLPSEGVEDVLSDLRDLGLEDDNYTVITDTDTVASEHFETLRERYAEETEDERIPSGQLRDRAEELNPSWLSFVGAAVLASIVVAAGLLRNSAAAVAGAMVIAPYFGTALSVSVGAVSGDRYLFANGVKHQVVGLVASVGAAAAVGVAARQFSLVPPDLAFTSIGQVSIFLTPTALSVLIAVAAGAAGALTFATATEVPLSGVAIAAAIIPSAGTVGLGIAWADPVVVAGAATLLLVNVVCINAVAILTLLALGNVPWSFNYQRDADYSRLQWGAIVVIGIVLLASVGGALVATAQHVSYDQSVNEAIDDVLDQSDYEAVSVESVRISYAGPAYLPVHRSVTMTLERPADASYPDLPDRLDRRISSRTGHEADVRIHFIDTARS